MLLGGFGERSIFVQNKTRNKYEEPTHLADTFPFHSFAVHNSSFISKVGFADEVEYNYPYHPYPIVRDLSLCGKCNCYVSNSH